MPASKTLIEKFIADVDADLPGVPGQSAAQADLRSYVAALEDDGRWALVATET